jgi:hypothetical protein
MGLLVYNHARFGTWFETGYRFAPGQEGFTTPPWWGIPGLLVSPARGLLWYNPPVWMAVLGWPRFRRAHRFLSSTMGLVVGVYLALFGTWWEWWGGYGWGPRFLLPILPYALLAGLPLLQSALTGPLASKVGVISLAIAGLAVQVGGVAIDFNIYERELDAHFPAPAEGPLRYHHNPGLVYDVARSPILVHWRRLGTGQGQLGWLLSRETSTASGIGTAILRAQQPRDAVISTVPELLYEWLDTRHLPPVFGLPYNLPDTDPLAGTLFERAQRGAARVWLVTQYGPGDAENWYEAQLRRGWASVGETWVGGLRLLLFARPPDRGTWVEAPTTFGAIRLAAYRTQVRDGTLFIEVAWQAAAQIEVSYITFVHIFDKHLTVVAGQDRLPLGGYKPTTAWLPDERVVDRFAFPLQDALAATAQVTVGWYEWPSLARLPVDGCEDAIEEHSCTLEMHVYHE